MPLQATREVSRPQGFSISYSQVSSGGDCDWRLRWQRARIRRSNLGIFLVYGSAFHRGVEAYMKKDALTYEDATRAAVGYLDREIRDPKREKLPLQWDDEPETNLDGTISKKASEYGRLWCRDAAVYWLQIQIPLWLSVYADDLVVERSEHQIFVPMRPEPHWKETWFFEAKLDMECRGDKIVDIKTAGKPWDLHDQRKSLLQARLYQGAYLKRYGHAPQFVFHVLPRIWDKETEGPALVIDQFEVTYDEEQTQKYINGIVRPKINQIEANAFAANPGSRLCSEKFCVYFSHCGFGSGSHM